ncbi:1,4-dihydroxy-2-naphthoate octaprenyltransferase [Amycolatopsis xylanica]|uniref:1,4-dihydroxy-2-naphthoate octaprenyltransferase n=1 Tax=Amycolatopsis xylanica TaxID=589385 RepID=A0A1H3TA04_9PSEU|nr:UbiA family prenyltransferase [Amycolatopsis xylanica]SDZ46698.1 1,4-dihydroxy-2-naphthoate octaprenyltransferase [Amycolatopsis xylanica]
MTGILAGARSAGTRSVREVLGGLFWLSKIAVYQHYFGWALAWLALSPSASARPGVTAAMLLFLVGSIAIVACACSADDLVGFRNGSDATNYQAGERQRNIKRKPLLSGALAEREVVMFVVASGALAVVAGIAAFWALDWQAPLEAYVGYFVGFAASVQYSAGLRLSYHSGGSETLLCLSTASGLLAPYLAVERSWSPQAVFMGLLLGFWLVMVSSYSNVNDAEGDRQAGRRTLATVGSPATVRAVMVALVLVSIGLVVALAAGTGWPWWTLLTMVPATALHVAQLYVGPVRGQYLRARRLGLYAYDLGFLGIGIPTLFVFLT